MNIENPKLKTLSTIMIIELVIPTVLLIFGIYHGLMQALYRAGIIKASGLFGIEYYQGLTLHGVINAIVFTTFFAVAFGNGIISYYLKKIPNLTVMKVSLGLMVVGTLTTAFPVFAGKASVLYTFYPPLKASPLFYIGATLLVIGSWVAFFNWLPCYASWRKENPGQKTPLAVFGIITTFIVWFMATIPVAVEILFVLLPWAFGWVQTVNVMLARTLFWFFGHALVYFWLLPSYVILYAMLPKIVGGKLYSDFAARLAFIMFIVFSVPVGLHHQFSDPAINIGWKWLHTVFTFFIATPSFITAFTVAATLEYASRTKGGKGLFSWWLNLPYWNRERWMFPYIFSGLLLFLFGGITGIINSSFVMNNMVHNTSWIPGHFHTTVGGLVFMTFTGMSLYMVSTLLGKKIVFPRMNLWVPYLWLLGVAIFSVAMSFSGLHGEPRRTNLGLTYLNSESPLFRPEWLKAAHFTALGGTIMFISMVLYFIVFFGTLFAKPSEARRLKFEELDVYHDEKVPWVMNFKPWLVMATLLIIFAYTIPLKDLLAGEGVTPVQGYDPSSPIPLGDGQDKGK